MHPHNTLAGFQAEAPALPAGPEEGTQSAEAVFPLSFTQQSLWFLHGQSSRANSAYNIVEGWRLAGRLDVTAFQESLALMSRRHESLRTVVREHGGVPMQVVMPPRPFALQLVDAGGMERSKLEQSFAKAAGAPFDLQNGPLARGFLFRLTEEEHVFLLNVHHIISDEWSVGVFLRESAAAYNAMCSGGQARLADLGIQYADFVVWQRGLAAGILEPDLKYWREHLRLPLAQVSLPVDMPRGGSSHDFLGETRFSCLPGELTAQLKQLSAQNGATLFMTLLAAFKVLLHRYTRQADIIVGSPMANRGLVETEGLIGLLVNTHALRTNLNGDPTFQELLARVREVVLGAYAHQAVPVEKVIEALHPPRQAGCHPLFQIVFGLQPAAAESWPLAGLKTTRMELDNGGSKFDYTLLLTEANDGLKVRSEYSTRLFKRETVEQLVRHFQTLLESIVAAPQRRISELPLFTPVERAALIDSASAIARCKSTRRECLPGIFEARAARDPEKTAISMGAESLSYGELNVSANRLAHHLRILGVRPDEPVALCLDRSPAMVTAMLAVLKAGGAYVPIDPSSPASRIEFILADTSARVVLTQESLRHIVPETATLRVLCLDTDHESLLAEPAENPERVNAPDDLAYIIYTSGSTGHPKGVLVSHGNVTRLFRQTEAWFNFSPDDVWTLFHAYTFDFSVWEIWGALLYGGRLVIVPYLVSRSPSEFYELLASEKVTVLNQTPSAFRQLIAAEASVCQQRKPHLRYVICGGEALEPGCLARWFERHGDSEPKVVNMYGITETTVHVTYRVIRQADATSGAGSVIGVPIPDLGLHLLDEKLEPVPNGVPGEICVSGAGVARGYLNRPDLTARRFVPDPFASSPGQRMYRSGDLARRTAQGELEYLGRMDDQVKVRGFRIELGEIECALNSHARVRESIVTAAGGANGDKRLVAYIVPDASVPDPAELRGHLLQRLPDYMVPSVFVPISGIPLTANGKADRGALPAPELSAAEAPGGAAPRNELEELVARTWRELLARKELGICENFFQAGGDSLLATRVMSRLAAALNLELSVRLLFEAPTIAELAAVLSQARSRQAEPGAAKAVVPVYNARDLLSRLDAFSDSEVDKLLKDLEKLPVLK